ncbi:unnamed protein product [Protopolystoma xenopodis]|uniref:Uncharacterized protein n=1 Tax=Protopolystoma xenopodis TaxID=117903 RepID=A0A448XT57_9PLAT|nr:unnamed protein product [Protopolystoma xenopodis]
MTVACRSRRQQMGCVDRHKRGAKGCRQKRPEAACRVAAMGFEAIRPSRRADMDSTGHRQTCGMPHPCSVVECTFRLPNL